MTLAEPLWIPLTLILVLLAAAVMVYAELRRRQLLQTLAQNRLLPELTANISLWRRRLKQILLLAALLCFGLAMARPQMGYRWEEIKRKGIDILFAIDTSRSMLAQDVRPSRLERSKLAVIDFSRNFNGGRLGLVPFAGTAFLMCPLTLDTEAFYESLQALDTNVIGRPGTNIGAAILEASQAFAKGSGDEKILVLITDGEDLSGEALSAARQVAEQGVKIHAVGVGTPAGDLIPDARGQGSNAFLRDNSGSFVKSRLDEGTLKQLASITGGSYHPLGQRGEGLEAILRENQHLMKELELKESMRKVPLEQFQWPLLAGLILLMAEMLLRESRRPTPPSPRQKQKSKLEAATLILLLILSPGLTPQARATLRQAEDSLKSGQMTQAMESYRLEWQKNPDNLQLLYNLGVAAYRSQDYEEATRAFAETRNTRDLGLQQKAYYNLGNTQFRRGEAALPNNVEAAIKEWEAALDSYQGALALKPGDKDAQFNHDLVKKRLEELKKNPPQKQPNSQNQNQDQNDPDQKNKDSGNSDKKDPNSSKDKSPDPSKNEPDKNGDPGKGSNPSQDPKPSPGQNPDPGKPDQNQEKPPESKPSPPAQDSQPKKDAKENNAPAQAQPGTPGQLTKEEAKALLNAAKSGQKQLLLPVTRSKENPSPQNGKDW
ncbi:MAG: VWA domain-containing protein [Blastochloris sp.]|nr:VWA domain-containing protein [Blastochloris sp.]